MQEDNSKETVEHNDPTSEQTLNEQTDNFESWKDDLAREVNNIVEQSEKHGANKESDGTDQDTDINKKDAHSSDTIKKPDGGNVQEGPQSDSLPNNKDVDSAEFSHVHVVDEGVKDEAPKSEEKLDSVKQSGETEETKKDDSIVQNQGQEAASDRQGQGDGKASSAAEESVEKEQQTTETLHEKVQSEDVSNQNSEDTKEQSSKEEVKGAQKKAGQYDHSKKKSKAKKGRGRKKILDHEEMDEWGNEQDDYGDIDDESYDEDMDDDIEDGEMDDFNEEEDADSIDSWKMSERPLEEAEDFGDEEDGKRKEQEDLQEEIKQLKGFISASFCYL